jgi:hypothetical protein
MAQAAYAAVGSTADGRGTPDDQDKYSAAEDAAAADRSKRDLETRRDAIVGRLTRLADQQVGYKQAIENRWVADLRAYYGRYDSATEAALANLNKSRMFVKLTRTRTLAWQARITDLLFPTDEKNWGIKPTAMPTLAQNARDAEKSMEGALQQANTQASDQDPTHAQTAGSADAFAQAKSHADSEIVEATRRCDLMERELDDQLTECRYPIRARDAIRDACKLGTGILKGPMVANRPRKTWKADPTPATSQTAMSGGSADWGMEAPADPAPEFLHVNPFHFFPDMSALEIDDAEFSFERHLLTITQMKALAKQPGFDLDRLAELVIEDNKSAMPNVMVQIREVTNTTDALDARFIMWEYHGPLEHEEACGIVAANGDHELLAALEKNQLAEYRVIIFFCNGKLLKFSVHPLDSGETLYSVFNFEKDDTSIFGLGVPNLMADSQSALNGGWRMIMDNSGLSVGPQVVIDKTQVEPANGAWDLTPRKIWHRTQTALVGAAPVFDVHNIPNNQADLANIIALARQFADDETSMPLIAQGEQGEHITPTATGMSLLMNSANVVFRRIIREFDDSMTTPNLRRLYDWNMQFNPNEELKGDMSVDARGSSVLLVREVQATNLTQMLNTWSVNPMTQPNLKIAAMMRKAAQALMISADEIILSDDEIAAMEKAKAQQPPPPSPEDTKLKIANITASNRLQVAQVTERIAQMNSQTELVRFANEKDMTLAQLTAMLHAKTIETNSKERIMAAEVGAEAQKAQQDKALGIPDKGSGGYI